MPERAAAEPGSSHSEVLTLEGCFLYTGKSKDGTVKSGMQFSFTQNPVEEVLLGLLRPGNQDFRGYAQPEIENIRHP